MGSYLRCVNLGASCRGHKNLTEKTLVGYMNSGNEAWQQLTGWHIPLYQPAGHKKEPQLHRFVADIMDQRRAWKQPKQKREPYTFAMFEALAKHLGAAHSFDRLVHLSIEFAVFDWSRLGIHTGSRLSEYGQSKPRRGEPIARIPFDSDAGEWAGLPLAFLRSDFTLYDEQLVRRSHPECIADLKLAAFVHIRFRYDKSVNNFTVRKFQRQSGSILCPVKAVLSILERADLLGIPTNEPLGAFRPQDAAAREYSFLNGTHVKDVMQQAVRWAYPDPNHYMRLHEHLVMSHSNRVTAAVALFNAGVPIPVIAHRLRWSVDSVTFYLRDCFRAIGPLTQKAVQGAYLN